jgi:hypothetical protein
MKTLSMPVPVERSGGTIAAPGLRGGGAIVRRPAEWLPVPAPPRVRTQARPVPKRLWAVGSPREPLTERLFMGVLAGAVLLGISHGFSCLVDLVQHWAVFGAGIDRFIQ